MRNPLFGPHRRGRSGRRTDGLGWLDIVRLGLVQAALGAIVVLTNSTLNRVLIVELGLAAVIPGIVMYWLDAPDAADLDAYISRRLQQASGLGRNAGRVVAPVLDFIKALRPDGNPSGRGQER